MTSFPEQAPLPTKPCSETRPGTGEKATEMPRNIPTKQTGGKAACPRAGTPVLSHSVIWGAAGLAQGPAAVLGTQQVHLI